MASEVWAALLNCDRVWAEGDRMHLSVLRSILAVRGSTPGLIVMAELGQYPLLCHIAKLVIRFWLRLERLDDSRLVKQAFLASKALAVQHQQGWTGDLMALLRSLGVAIGPENLLSALTDLVEGKLQSLHLERFNNAKGSKFEEYRIGVRGGGNTTEHYLPQPYLLKLQRATPASAGRAAFTRPSNMELSTYLQT